MLHSLLKAADVQAMAYVVSPLQAPTTSPAHCSLGSIAWMNRLMEVVEVATAQLKSRKAGIGLYSIFFADSHRSCREAGMTSREK